MCVSTINEKVQCLDSYNIISFDNTSFSFNQINGDLSAYKGAHLGSYLIASVPSTHPIGFRVPNELSSAITISGDEFAGSININGINVNFFYGDVILEITENLPMSIINFGHKNDLSSFSENQLLIHDYCAIDSPSRYYYSSTPIPINCSECNNSMLETLYKIEY